jgi:hypothetical protein
MTKKKKPIVHDEWATFLKAHLGVGDEIMVECNPGDAPWVTYVGRIYDSGVAPEGGPALSVDCPHHSEHARAHTPERITERLLDFEDDELAVELGERQRRKAAGA